MEYNDARIMIVDDSAQSIDLMGNILKNYKKIIATSGKKAVEKLSSGVVPDVAIVDVVMPDIGGLDICRFIKENEKTKDIRVILISGNSKAEDEEEAYNSGADDFIVKPFYPRGFMERVKNQMLIKKLIQKNGGII